MPANSRSRTETSPEPADARSPEITACESRPGKSVFIESGNTDGWIASDLTVDVTQ